MSKFFVGPEAVAEGNITITDIEDIKHITKVLRLKEGDKIEISDSVAWEYEAEIFSMDKDLVEVQILDKQSFAHEPELKVTLFQGIPKQGKMEVIIQKCVELGIFSIVPVFTARTIVTDKGNFSKKIDRWQKVSDEAVKQCKRGIIPEIGAEIKFKDMPPKLSEFDMVILPYENEEDQSIKDCLRKVVNNKPKSIAVIIGPEGGFAKEETEILKEIGAHCVTLGKTTLRTETAGMAALAMIMYELEL